MVMKMTKKLNPIKWRKEDEKKLLYRVRKFNAAITRMERQYPEYAGTTIIPERMKFSEQKSQIKTRREYNKIIKRIDRFFNKGARDVVTIEGIRTTRWEKKEIQYSLQSIKARQKKIPAAVKANKPSFDLKKRAEILKENLKETGDIESFNQDWKNFVYKLMRESRSSKEVEESIRYYNQFMNMLRNNLEPEDANRIIALIREKKLMGSDLFYATSLDPELEPDFLYGPEDSMTKAEYIEDALEKIFPKEVHKPTPEELEQQEKLQKFMETTLA